MMRRTDRILVPDAGALPRPAALQRLYAAGPAREMAFREAVSGSADRPVAAR